MAYEVRIRDWSSDVCSSDLLSLTIRGPHPMPLSPPVERTCLHNRTYDFQGSQRADGLWDLEGRIVDTKTYPFANKEIGRASCRERVCKYVSISVVSG